MQIIPKPNKMLISKNSYELRANATFYCEFFDCGLSFMKLLWRNDLPLSVSPSPDADINFIKAEGMGGEEYALEITEKGITLTASASAGCFYGLQSLRMLGDFDTAGKTQALTLPLVKISDKPRFKYRSFMLDESRHFLGKDFVKELLDMMALLKLNTFHWHLTDDQGWRIEIKKYPLLTEKGSIRTENGVEYGRGKFYTQKEIKEIVDYAKSLHIQIVPEIDMPGHLVAAITCYPDLTCNKNETDAEGKWGVKDTIACVGDDQIYEFAENVIDELSGLFPSVYFHIGGDEVPRTQWKSCPKCQALMREKGMKSEDELQIYFNNRILDYLKTKGKKLVGWNEILYGNNLDSSAVVQWWTGDRYKNGVVKWLEKGNKVILSHSKYLYCDYPYAIAPLKRYYNLFKELELDKSFEKSILGIDSPLWTEYVSERGKACFNTYPRLAALAELCWTNEKLKKFSDFERRLEDFFKLLQVYGIPYAPKTYYNGKPHIAKRAYWMSWANREYDDYLRT